MALCGCSELAIEGRDVDSLFLKACNELPPNVGGAGVEAENAAFHALAETGEPGLQRRFPLSGREGLDAPAEFSDRDGAQVEIRLVVAEPRQDKRFRLGLCEFAQDVGIHQKAHSEMAGVKSLARGGASNG